ncbi:MAG TPA: phosphatidylserine/phosphatidylglycerophosphate/cardiolipin synthase family protein [Streptosporangiaceae bacterium]|nr:phosphatidylserine/phosphatidylglycerophosphate/cardiolipin synthase family protein [Streptosporangiaceae bacterium]
MTTDWKHVLAANGKGAVVREGNRVDALIDGPETYQAMYEAIRTTFSKQGGFYIYLLAWWLDGEVPLSPGDRDSVFTAMLRRASQEFGVQVRVLLWKNRVASLWPFEPKAQDRLHDEIGKLPTGACLLDNVLPNPYIAHHQKVLIVKGAQGLIGFCGGLDIAFDRIRHVDLHDGSPFHDAHCRIEGPAACDLVDVFAQRWAAHPDAKSVDKAQEPLRGLADRTPLKGSGKPAGTLSVGIARTYLAPRQDVPPDRPDAWCAENFSVWPMLQAAIAAARRFIYIEDQYLVGMAAADELAAVAGRLQHITILVNGRTDLPYNRLGMAKFVYRLWQDTRLSARIRIFHLPPGNGSYIHAKTWVIDDELALIGSANVNRRGWAADSEAHAAIYDKPASAPAPSFAQRYRMRLWSRHLGVDPDSVRNGTDPTPWVTAANNDKVVTYDPFAQVSKKDAERFPDPNAIAMAPAALAAYVVGYHGPKTIKGVWDNILDPPARPAAPCPGSEKRCPR